MESRSEQVQSAAAALVETKQINPQEADEILSEWERLSLRVCLAVCVGELAWHAHWVGILRNAHQGRWILATGQTTNMLTTDQYSEIILTHDDELVGLRFRQPVGHVPSFEVALFIDKNDDLDEHTIINRIIQ